MGKIGWLINAVLVVAVAVMAYVFIFKGSIEPAEDGRTAVLVSVGERDYILEEMRGFLEAIEAITSGLADEDTKEVIASAEKLGMKNMSVPPALLGKLPIAFKTLGIETHKLFDTFADGVKQGSDPKTTLTNLSTILNNCTSCHSAYRLGLEGKAKE